MVMRSRLFIIIILAVFFIMPYQAASAQDTYPLRPHPSGKGLGVELTGNHATLHKVLVGFQSFPGKAEEALVRGAGGTIKYTYHLVPAIAATIPEAAIEGLIRNPNVTRIDPDGLVHAIDAELDNTWGVKRIGSGTVHDGGNRGTGIKVAIIDSGVDYTHPDLDDNYAGGYDFINNDSDPKDDNGHGTHVAGTAAAEDDDYGVVGVAPDAALFALKVLDSSGSGNWSDVIAALEWGVDHGIQVTNNSYGSGTNPGGIVQAAFDNSYAAGILHIAAAGNSGNPKGKGSNVDYPARYESVVAVAATDEGDNRAWFSSTGDAVELAAPGTVINSTLPGGVYGKYSGTSMASPHVAGAAALVIAAGIADTDGNGLINDEVRLTLDENADDLGDTGRDPQYGYGLVNAAAAVAALGPPNPGVSVYLSTNKTDYISGQDTKAALTAVVTDEYGDPITGLGSTSFGTTLDGISADIVFAETATSGTYTGELDITGLDDGTHVVDTTATDTRNFSGTDSATFTTGPAPAETTGVIVDSIVYATEGGKNNDRHLLITIALVDDLSNQVAGASVSIRLDLNTGNSWIGTGTTGTDGKMTFSLKNAPSGCYTTTVTDITAEGLTWDGATPSNSFCK